MSDIDPIWWLIGLGFVTSFFATLFSDSIGKIIAVIAGLPALVYMISVISSGIQVHNIQDLNPWVTAVVSGLVPLLITAIGEALGTPCGVSLRKLLKWD